MSYYILRLKLWIRQIRRDARPVHWIIAALIALVVLGTVLPRLLWKFSYTDDGMTDGEHDYAYLYDWSYRGKFRYFLGWSKDGRPVYAADEEGMIIKKREKWYQDMPYRPLYRTDLSFPDIYTDECKVSIRLTTEKKEIFYETSYGYTQKWIDLSPDGAQAFQSVLKQLHAMKEAGASQQDYSKSNKDTLADGARIKNPAFPQLTYDVYVELFWIDGRIYAWFEEKYCMEIDSDSALYAELKQYHDLYR